MAFFSSKIITYKELKDGTYKSAYIPQDDKFPVTTHLTSGLRDALLDCPAHTDDSKTFMYVFVDDENKEIGRVFLHGTRIQCGNEEYLGQTGLALEVVKEYRDESVGAELMLYSPFNKEYDYTLGAGISHMILPMYRKLKFHMFEVPQYIKIIHSRYALKRYCFKGAMLKMVAGIGDCVIKIMNIPNRIRGFRMSKKYIIKKESIIPDWVTEMTTNEGHKYKEVHDREWFQWIIDHNAQDIDECKDVIKSFYSVCDKQNKPLGFFMTKERLNMQSGPRNGYHVGTVVEWESIDKNILSESDLNLLACRTFSKKVDLIITLACEIGTGKELGKMGFVRRGVYYIGLKDKKKQLKDAGDQNKWRLRFGYTNMAL